MIHNPAQSLVKHSAIRYLSAAMLLLCVSTACRQAPPPVIPELASKESNAAAKQSLQSPKPSSNQPAESIPVNEPAAPEPDTSVMPKPTESVEADPSPRSATPVADSSSKRQAEKEILAFTKKVRRDGNDELIEVDFRDTEAGDAEMKLLVDLPKLRSVLLLGTKVSDAGLETLGQIPTLENLDLRDCSVSDDGLKSLSKLGRLKALKLMGRSGDCTVSDTGLEHVAKFPELKVLGLDFLWEISDDGIAKLAPLKNLQELYLAETTVGDATIEHLAKFPTLRKLRLARNQIEAAGIAALPKLSSLEELDLSECSQILDSAMGPLGECKNLKKLNLWRVNISDEGLKPIQHLTNLESLNLDNTRLSDEGASYLSGLTKLTFLHLGSTQITNQALTHLEGLTNLKDLVVTRTAVDEEGVEQLQEKLPNTKIQLEYTGDE